jgi:hypothetical protein
MSEEKEKKEEIKLVDIRRVIEYESVEEIMEFIKEYPEVWKNEEERVFASGFLIGYRECLTRLMSETDRSQSRNLSPTFFERDGTVHVLDIVITTSEENYIKWWEETGKHKRGEWLEDIRKMLQSKKQEA